MSKTVQQPLKPAALDPESDLLQSHVEDRGLDVPGLSERIAVGEWAAAAAELGRVVADRLLNGQLVDRRK
jgi:hypothetical protein